MKIINIKIESKTYFYKIYDLEWIELKEDDEKNNYLELDNNLFKKEINTYCEDIPIYKLQHPLGNNSSVSYGLSNLINEYDIKHACNTEHDSSGLPILNLSTNKLIGIHKQSSKKNNYNIGTCLHYPINDFLFNKKWRK